MFEQLQTEQSNTQSAEIDRLATSEILGVMSATDAEIATAVARDIPRIAAVVDAIAWALDHGGHLIYIGAGTSGRLGVLDASECPPTFGVPATLVRGPALTSATDDHAAAGVTGRSRGRLGFRRCTGRQLSGLCSADAPACRIQTRKPGAERLPPPAAQESNRTYWRLLLPHPPTTGPRPRTPTPTRESFIDSERRPA